MNDKMKELHRMVDDLPDETLQCAEQALKYCAKPAETRFTIERAKERVRAMSMRTFRRTKQGDGRRFYHQRRDWRFKDDAHWRFQ
jgi:hypothetical protein